MEQKIRKEEKVNRGSWMNTYADMVTLLLCFFVLLFAMSEVDVERFEQMARALAGRNFLMTGAMGTFFNDSSGIMPDQSPPIPLRQIPDAPIVDDLEEIVDIVTGRIGELEGMADAFRTYMAQYEALEQIGIRVDDLGEYMAITFPSGMLFESGQDVLTYDAIEMLDYVAVRLAGFPGHRIAVHGHTDNVPISTLQFPSNWHLSFARSFAVVDRLIQGHYFDPWMLEAVGMGEYRPVASNDTPEGRAENRRVEILVFARQQSLTVITD